MIKFHKLFLNKSQTDIPSFSVKGLLKSNGSFLDGYVWKKNQLPGLLTNEIWMQLGCGERIFDDFMNVDFIPGNSKVVCWDFLDLWPGELDDQVMGVFSEDMMEHFYYPEQLYILCCVNRVLKKNAVFRVLMPNLDHLVGGLGTFVLKKEDYFFQVAGAITGADAFNTGMRFSGHRWLHNSGSFKNMAGFSGFEAVDTDCTSSTEEKFNHLNLRDESNSLSFAVDLKKSGTISRIEAEHSEIVNAEFIEVIDPLQSLYISTKQQAMITYEFSFPVKVRDLILINIRSSNFSNKREHSLKYMYFITKDKTVKWKLDETLKSAPFMNCVVFSQLSCILDESDEIQGIEFLPAAGDQEYFSVGICELFYLKDANRTGEMFAENL